MTNLVSIILAAGEGTRMKSTLPKVLHQICGQPMLLYVLKAVLSAGCRKNYLVVGHKGKSVIEALRNFLPLKKKGIEFVKQNKLLGSGHAVLQVKKNLKGYRGNVLVVYGDLPLLTAGTVNRLVQAHYKQDNSLTILGATLEDPSGYGRIIEKGNGKEIRIVEERDATPDERRINTVNAGVYCFRAEDLFKAIDKIRPDNRKKEYYLTDTVKILRDMGKKVRMVTTKDSSEVEGVNNRKQLVSVQKYVNMKNLERLLLAGVTIVDPSSTFVDSTVKIGRDTVIYPGSTILGKTKIGENCKLGPHAFIENCQIEKGVEVRASFIYGAKIAERAKVGPFSHIRPGTFVGEGVRVGNFCEVKKSRIGKGTKVSHLSYIGDAFLGKGVNIGAGTITCNFDGVRKNITRIGDNTFVGSDAKFIAPVKIGKGAVIGAGSTITEDVPPGKLAIARARQVIKDRKKKKKIKR
ncbi:bifunctional UDP-N-acetylglucosamine diphosphorylase/glucosamine-1-phosphate N-acetyltransferase GlmU [bacterium]|nr:bifunctional UDP-N-acetylglucosamine diphosphorylase/glucosamine-1-phosphate N-acetyltransferase GlmU [bacterium]NIN92837.1 bifunctional UDP-N-acetylglucosamine diphosphorylase/glucosamine-1-phosphate N-acetyltransferase GlmU [bacterium]NIO18792.1 bifunctional UDP-N-acetylglucosamine diphosphorylase/glucosamine-1-phosphate N-acetyltransferase GlmU [bacterium]NIO73873.1 bifunctional UDP-N-acetylglucosamine diphosphorylase/glucosamine-1-phosphate N-acetyltransferase GlmU [bacterium]